MPNFRSPWLNIDCGQSHISFYIFWVRCHKIWWRQHDHLSMFDMSRFGKEYPHSVWPLLRCYLLFNGILPNLMLFRNRFWLMRNLFFWIEFIPKMLLFRILPNDYNLQPFHKFEEIKLLIIVLAANMLTFLLWMVNKMIFLSSF